MRRVFADTSFYLASFNPRDRWHQRTLDIGARFAGSMVTTEYVLLELGNHLASPSDRGLFLTVARLLQEDPKTVLVPASTDLMKAGIDLFGKRPDKGWSLTDCLSFLVMEQYGISEALTCDRHFEQAGFRSLMRD